MISTIIITITCIITVINTFNFILTHLFTNQQGIHFSKLSSPMNLQKIYLDKKLVFSERELSDNWLSVISRNVNNKQISLANKHRTHLLTIPYWTRSKILPPFFPSEKINLVSSSFQRNYIFHPRRDCSYWRRMIDLVFHTNLSVHKAGNFTFRTKNHRAPNGRPAVV